MQLKKQSSLRGALTAVTAVLIGSSMAGAADSGNKIESSLLLYQETDRVQAAEGIVGASYSLRNGGTFSGRFTFDALTGPSPNGATPSNNIQTFTRPSGAGSYTTNAGEVPFDDTFHDTRLSFDASYSQLLNRVTTLDFGGHFSAEHDYTSIGGNVGLSRDFNKRNTTLSLSAAFSHDLINPEGGVPLPYASLLAVGDDDENDDQFDDKSPTRAAQDEDDNEHEGSSDNKNVFDAVFGLTQVLDRQTLLRLNYSFNHSSGYLNDPYKIVSIVQNQASAQPGEPVDYLFESRPDSRSKHALFAQVRRYISGHTVDLSYRYFWDDWGVTSHTIDAHYRLPLGGGHALQPHVRWYKQSAADFYKTYLVDNAPTPTHASADYRLAPFHAITLGLQYLLPVGERTHLSLGGEYYLQTGDISPPTDMGPLSQHELFPDMKAFMLRAGFTFDF